MEKRKFTIRSFLYESLMTLAYCLCVVTTFWCYGSFSSSVLNGPRGLMGPRVRFLQHAVIIFQINATGIHSRTDKDRLWIAADNSLSAP